jgi:hypothetical protein
MPRLTQVSWKATIDGEEYGDTILADLDSDDSASSVNTLAYMLALHLKESALAILQNRPKRTELLEKEMKKTAPDLR